MPQNGGARPGSGRPKGGHNNPFRKKLNAFLKDPEVEKEYFDGLRWHLKEKDKDIIKWLGDQGAGKARQDIEVSGELDQNVYDTGTFTDAQLRKALGRRGVNKPVEPASDGGAVVDGASTPGPA